MTLEARYGLANVGASVYFICKDGASDDLIFTPIETNPPSANLVRGNSTATVILGPAGSGSKYIGDNGVSFWTKGKDAIVE
ncbi:MAG: MliC family protein [Hyphomicrobium sp.]